MTNNEAIGILMKQNNGTVTTSDVQSLGISKPFFMGYVQNNGLKKVAHGIYISDDAWPDEFQLLQLQLSSSGFCLEK